MRAVIVRDGQGLKILLLPHGRRPSNMICEAPRGFGPGDEKFLRLENGALIADREGKAKEVRAKAEGAMSKSEWNNQGVMDRLKSKLKG